MGYAFIDTPIGDMLAVFGETGLRSLEFSDDPEKSLFNCKHEGELELHSPEQLNMLNKLTRELVDYFSGELKEFSVPLSISGTEFQQQVWKELIEIPYGTTRSYAWLSDRLGNRKLIRAAASANGKNPVAIIIPCHRVIGSDGSLTGYATGLYRKKWLLDLEAIHADLSGTSSVQLKLFD